MKRKNQKKVCGVGINDAVTPVTYIKDGKKVTCKFYQAWSSMMVHCYSKKFKDRYPSYEGCVVDERWHSFSAFSEWMRAQDFHGKHLDKDLLSKNGKIYSPETCVFIDPALNNFLLDHKTGKGKWPLGVTVSRKSELFQAQCRNPFTGKNEYLGQYIHPYGAHVAWRLKKADHAIQLAGMQTDTRVSDALKSLAKEWRTVVF